MGAPQILLITAARADDEQLLNALCREGYEVHVYHSARNATLWARENLPDLVIYNAATMASDGVAGCRKLRALIGAAPLIHTRKQGEPKNEDAQADIYLVKPFTARKIINRARALLPADQFTQEIIRAGDVTLFRSKPSVAVAGASEKALTPKLAQLLEEFLRHPNQVLDRRQLMRNVWETDYLGDTRTLDVHIRWAREAIEENPSKPRRIVTVRGVGYFFSLPPIQK